MTKKLKEIPKDNKGLPNLPKEVRKTMGYFSTGGLLSDDRERYGIGGLLSKLAKLRDRKSKIDKELLTENVAKKTEQKLVKDQDNLDSQIEKLQSQIDEGTVPEAQAALQTEMSQLANELQQRGISEDRIDEILEEVFDNRNYSELEEALRVPKQEGGSMSIDDQMQMVMNQPMLPDEEMEDNYLDFIIDEALDEEEEDMLMSKLEQDEQLSMLFDKVIEVASEFAGSGTVEGPGSGVSDSIPARLSDGEFVFTAKATEQIGADELMRMMKDAEADADRQGMQEGGLFGNSEEELEDSNQEIKNQMMGTNPRYQ